MAMGRIHTDLALETKEKFEEDNVEIRGVEIQEDYDEEKDIRTTVVKIKTENGAKSMGRPLSLEYSSLKQFRQSLWLTDIFCQHAIFSI